jgi:hypothetical protein
MTHYTEIMDELLEAPQIVPPTDWNLSSRSVNAAYALYFKRPPAAEVFRDFPTAQLLVQTGNVGGQIGLVSKITGLLEYYVYYEIANMGTLGRCATQIKLWRSRRATVPNLTRIGFGGILLRRFDTIISDLQQTDRGREFWEGQLSIYQSRKTVGFVSDAGIQCFDHSVPIADWIDQQDGCGVSRSYRRKRFFISNRSITQLAPP